MAHSIKTYTGDGVTTDFLFDKPYIKEADVYGFVDDIQQSTTIVNGTIVRFATAPADATEVVVRRISDIETARHTFPNPSYIKSTNLDGNSEHQLYLHQEAQDVANGATGNEVSIGDLIITSTPTEDNILSEKPTFSLSVGANDAIVMTEATAGGGETVVDSTLDPNFATACGGGNWICTGGSAAWEITANELIADNTTYRLLTYDNTMTFDPAKTYRVTIQFDAATRVFAYGQFLLGSNNASGQPGNVQVDDAPEGDLDRVTGIQSVLVTGVTGSGWVYENLTEWNDSIAQVITEMKIEEVTIAAATGGETKINHGGATKLETTDTGVAVTGGVVASGSATIGGAAAVAGGVDKLTTASGVVSVAAAAAPTAGMVLTATSATLAQWQALADSSANWLHANNGVDFDQAPSGTGSYSIALGRSCNTGTALYAVAIGEGVLNNNHDESIAIGRTAAIQGVAATAVGRGANAGASSVALGHLALGYGTNNIAIGKSAQVVGTASNQISIGESAFASKVGQVVLGAGIAQADVGTDVAYSVKLGYGFTSAADKNMLHLHSKGKLELLGAEAQYVLPNYTTATLPATAVVGGLVYDTDTNEIKVYDTSWTAISGGASSPLTTKGDVYTFSTVDARLPVGTNDQVLTADSSTATGLAWKTPAAGGAANNWVHANNGNDFTTAPSGTGLNSISIGVSVNTGFGAYNVAIGAYNSTNNYDEQVLIGRNTSGTSSYAVAIGSQSTSGADSIALGDAAQAPGTDNIAIGHLAQVVGAYQNQISIGETAYASKTGQVAIGAGITQTDVTTDVAYSVKLGYAFSSAADKNLLHLHSKGKLELYGSEAQYVFPNYATASIPTTTVEGGAVYDSTVNRLHVNDGTDFQPVAMGAIRTKVLSLGNWNMTSTSLHSVAHGLTMSKIVGLTATVHNDAGDRVYNFIEPGQTDTSGESGGEVIYASAALISLSHNLSGRFTTTDWDGTQNRGYVVVQYID